MAKTNSVKVHRVVVKKERGGWSWTPTDAQGRVTLPGGMMDYGRRWDAVRGARRACGPNVRIVLQ